MTQRFTPVLLIFLFWCVVGALNLGLSSIDGFHSIRTTAGSLTAVAGIPLSLVLHYLLKWLRNVQRPVLWSAAVILVAAAGTALWVANTLFQAWASGHTPVGGWPGDWFVRARMSWTYFTSLFVLQVLVTSLLDSMRMLQARERQLVEARLAALRFQLNPHFLFNTLNAISTLVAEAGATEAEEMLARLSTFLRTSLSGDPTDLVPLAAELEMVQAYLDIESVRFGDRLAVRYACEAGLAEALVPGLILQPLVENAVKYAVAPAKMQVTVAIEASFAGKELILLVEDDGAHLAPAPAVGTGVGLRNVAARLDALYGPDAHLEAFRRERGFTAVVRLPLRWSEAR